MRDGWRVVIVDDDKATADLHAALVRRVPGYDVVGIAHTASAATEQLLELRPHLVLLDLALPDATGVSVLQGARARGLPLDVIAVTAAASTRVVQRMLHLGVLDYLLKPFKPQRLAEALKRFETRMAAWEASEIDQAAIDETRVAVRSLPKDISSGRLSDVAHALAEAAVPLSADDVGQRLHMARPTARRYLEYLVLEGRAEVGLLRGGVGRPRKTYGLLVR